MKQVTLEHLEILRRDLQQKYLAKIEAVQEFDGGRDKMIKAIAEADDARRRLERVVQAWQNFQDIDDVLLNYIEQLGKAGKE